MSYLMFSDPVLQKLLKKYPPPDFKDRSIFLFEDLIETIISQQLSGKVADSIFKKFKQLFNADSFPAPQQVLSVKQESIRGIGVSNSKASYIHNVAKAFVDGVVVIDEILKMTDEELIATLTKIKGIGKWSSEMILIFTLNRPDVFSIDDLGIRNAIKKLYGITDRKEMIKLSENWKPNRSTACWYLWRGLENR